MTISLLQIPYSIVVIIESSKNKNKRPKKKKKKGKRKRLGHKCGMILNET